MGLYLKNAIWDFLLCVICAAALSYTACSVFYATQPFQTLTGGAIIVLVSALLTAALFAITINTSTAVFGSIGLAVVIIAVLAACFATSAGGSVLDDVAGNNIFFALALIIPPVLVFLLSRKRLLCLVLIVLGIVFCALVEYLYWYNHIIAFLIFLLAGIALLAYRTYQASVLNSESEYLAFNSVTLAGIAMTLVALLVAGGVYAAVVAPLNPPNVVVKLLTAHYRVDETKITGIGDVQSVQNSSLFSHKTGDDVALTDNVNEDFTSAKGDNDADAGSSTEQAITQSSTNSASLGNLGGDTQTQSYGVPQWLPFIIAIAVVLLIVLAVLLKRYLRKRRYDKMVAGGNGEAVEALFLFFLTRFKRFKIPLPVTQTLSEYAVATESKFQEFEGASEASAFSGLTSIYMQSVYSDTAVTDEQCQSFKDYYGSFYKMARNYIGKIRYCFVYFFI